MVVVSGPIASHCSERRGGAAVATVIDGVCKEIDSRNAVRISLAPAGPKARPDDSGI
jgi:hypothetical protein